MRSIVFFLVTVLMSQTAIAQRMVRYIKISEATLDVSDNTFGNAVVLAQLTIDIPDTGKVMVHVDGYLRSTPGDRITIAASNEPNWSGNVGSIGCEAASADIDRNSFSHTMVYDVSSGMQTFYAVAQNYVETDGDGIIDIHGMLTVEFLPGGPNDLQQVSIHENDLDLSDNPYQDPEILTQITVQAPVNGSVILRFDGNCVASPGDRIILAASDTTQWGSNDGNASFEVVDADVNRRSFSHTRVYSVSPGFHDFYAVAGNYVETDGDGIVSIYASFTAEFVPDTLVIAHSPVNSTLVDVSDTTQGNAVDLAQTTIDVQTGGVVLVTFDGKCIASPGDRIVLAASNSGLWSSGNGHVEIEVFDSDVNIAPFSHTMAYDVGPGTHSFHALMQNFFEYDGDGVASAYGSLTVKFFPEVITSISEIQSNMVRIYPNPSTGKLNIADQSLNAHQIGGFKIFDLNGRLVQEGNIDNNASELFLRKLPDGSYYLYLTNSEEDVPTLHKIVLRSEQ